MVFRPNGWLTYRLVAAGNYVRTCMVFGVSQIVGVFLRSLDAHGGRCGRCCACLHLPSTSCRTKANIILFVLFARSLNAYYTSVITTITRKLGPRMSCVWSRCKWFSPCLGRLASRGGGWGAVGQTTEQKKCWLNAELGFGKGAPQNEQDGGYFLLA